MPIACNPFFDRRIQDNKFLYDVLKIYVLSFKIML